MRGGVFDAHTETIADVYTFVREILSKENKNEVNFELFVALRRCPQTKRPRGEPFPIRRWLSSRRESILFVSLRCAFSTKKTPYSAPSVWKCFDCTTRLRRLRNPCDPFRRPIQRESERERGHFPRRDDDDDVWGENNRPGGAKKSFVPKWFKK